MPSIPRRKISYPEAPIRPARHNPKLGIMAELVEDRAVPTFSRREHMTRRHLDVIISERIEGSVAADPDRDAATRDDGLGSVGCAPGRFGGTRQRELGNALDLARVEQREDTQQRDVSCLSVLVVFRVLPLIRHLDPLEKVGCCSASALLHLPATV